MDRNSLENHMISGSLDRFLINNYSELSMYALNLIKEILIKDHFRELEQIALYENQDAMESYFFHSDFSNNFFYEMNLWKNFESEKAKEFKSIIKSCKKILKEKKTVLPLEGEWANFFYNEFLTNHEYNSSGIDLTTLQKLPQITSVEILKWLNQSTSEPNDIQELEAITIIAHKLKILEVAGILDTIDKIFCEKYYKSNKVILGQKAAFLAQIMGVPDQAQRVWDVLRKNEYQKSTFALKAAHKLFQETGVEKYFDEKEGLNFY